MSRVAGVLSWAFSHVSIGVSDIEKSGAFYDAVMQPVGYKRLVDGAKIEAFYNKSSGYA
jgi:catechol 2,3-dioxygenase-like lactoylglutathione lyase family enzyme